MANTDSQAVFLDANVLLETILSHRQYAKKVQNYIANHETIISPLTAHLFIYFGKKDGLKLNTLFTLLQQQNIADFGANEVIWAIKNCQGSGFEDALQIACAVSSTADTFVTLDKKLAQSYKNFIKTVAL